MFGAIKNQYHFFLNHLYIRLKKVTVGKNLTIRGKIALHGNGKITIGNDCTINSAPMVNPVAGGQRTHLRAEGDGKLIIGNNVGISHSAITAMERIQIEDDVLIGSNSMICDTDFHSISYDARMKKPDRTVKTAPVTIKKGAFIGARCIILKGVTIGERAVVGAGSVVSKSIPADEIWAGNPAKFIKKING